ncbi:hypothetical protein DDD_1390 [Nonlabens dokdonensis DSW-6]|uniref:Lipoprotein SmpA/OmlA domain-containing protein n=2 Tax=Nonlabens dokdonensis TaxID=328515 RepID=L7W8H1_NONDD|nr:hypothetical protein DDD_1390 [Nonlabens dokdonensis DSW-6]
MVVTLITAPLIYSVLIIVFFSILFYEPQLDFNKERWMKIEQGRYKMRDDLVDSKILNGKTKKEVIDLIGRSRSADSTNVWTYDLGTSGAGLGWQFNYLEIKFANDKVNTVKKIEIVD